MIWFTIIYFICVIINIWYIIKDYKEYRLSSKTIEGLFKYKEGIIWISLVPIANILSAMMFICISIWNKIKDIEL